MFAMAVAESRLLRLLAPRLLLLLILPPSLLLLLLPLRLPLLLLLLPCHSCHLKGCFVRRRQCLVPMLMLGLVPVTAGATAIATTPAAAATFASPSVAVIPVVRHTVTMLIAPERIVEMPQPTM